MTTAVYQQSHKLLLDDSLTEGQIRNLLAPVRFGNWQAAYKSLRQIAGHSPATRAALADGLPALLMAMTGTANPNRVLVNFERFVQSAGHPDQLLHHLADNPRGFEILTTLFAGSQFLTEIVLRHPHHFDQLVDHRQFSQIKSAQQLKQEAQAVVSPYLKNEPLPDDDLTAALEALRRFQRHELLRVGTCDLLGLLDLPTVTTQLSILTDSLARAALTLAGHHTQTNPDNFAVLGMGKLGGQELNYSSDIDLIFLAKAEPNKYWKLGQTFIDVLARPTDEGFLYRVDMRLRPWGRSGALVNSVDGHCRYLEKNGSLWEQQALLKARHIAGNDEVSRQFLQQIRPLIFSTDGEPLRVSIHTLKQRIEGRLSQREREGGEVKLGEGSIRDIEFVTQYLQLIHGPGPDDNTLRLTNTMNALANLKKAGILPPDEYRVLTNGYIFLRTVEHHLQLMHYRQVHTLPNNAEALANLARRLGFQGAEAGAHFAEQYHQHRAVIRAVYQRHLANEEPPTNGSSLPPPDTLALLTRMHPSYVSTFSEADIAHHARLIETLNSKQQIEVEASPVDDDHWQITIIGHDYLGVLSLICGLFVVYGLDIVDGHVFTYGPDPDPPPEPPKRRWFRRKKRAPAPPPASSRKIVDVFTVRPLQLGNDCKKIETEIWPNYTADLKTLFQRLLDGQQHEVQGELAKRVALALPQNFNPGAALPPVDIQIDNEESKRHTVLRIDALDTFGFLYEFTNALALSEINIRRMTVASQGSRVRDMLYVTDAQKNKITDPKKQRELRAATVLIKHFTHLLPRSPNPESALLHFREFVGRLFTRPNWPDELTSLEQPEVLKRLARLLGISDFLWNDFLRMQHANLFPMVQNVDALASPAIKSELREALAIELQKASPGSAKQMALNAFKDREMFRIDMRQIQGYITEFGQFSTELTDLAEVIVEAAYHLAVKELRAHFGLPRLENGSECPLTICALGKCGGQELGFASDIELMFIFGGSGRTTGPRVITTTEFFIKLVQDVNQIIQTKRAGIFEIDLQLRPYGKAGSMAVSIDAFNGYFGSDGDAWPYERQALVKLRPIAGDLKFGQQIMRLRDNLIYTYEPFDVAAMRAMRERQIRHLVTAGTFHAKFSPGGLVDVEYLVQGLQITHGYHNASLRQSNTRAAMQALAAAKIIPAKDYPQLHAAYTFLRNLINALRMVRGNAKDLTVPAADDEAFAYLARRLNYGYDLARLQDDLTQYTNHIQEINQRLLK